MIALQLLLCLQDDKQAGLYCRYVVEDSNQTARLLVCLAGQQAIGQLRWMSTSTASSNQQQAEGPTSGSSACGNI
jgi:hypothetical protein